MIIAVQFICIINDNMKIIKIYKKKLSCFFVILSVISNSNNTNCFLFSPFFCLHFLDNNYLGSFYSLPVSTINRYISTRLYKCKLDVHLAFFTNVKSLSYLCILAKENRNDYKRKKQNNGT
jgi:hypothetical protein